MGPQRHEPIEFAAGDTLWFYRFLPEFPSTAGWVLSYELYTEGGAYTEITFSANAANNGFEISEPNFAATLDPKVGYVLAGFVNNPTINGGVRHEVYRGNLKLTPNLAAQQAVDSFKPYELQQVETLRCTLLELNKSYVGETDIQRVRILREKREAIRLELGYWEEKLNNYLNKQKVQNGQADPTLIRPAFNFSF